MEREGCQHGGYTTGNTRAFSPKSLSLTWASSQFSPFPPPFPPINKGDFSLALYPSLTKLGISWLTSKDLGDPGFFKPDLWVHLGWCYRDCSFGGPQLPLRLTDSSSCPHLQDCLPSPWAASTIDTSASSIGPGHWVPDRAVGPVTGRSLPFPWSHPFQLPWQRNSSLAEHHVVLMPIFSLVVLAPGSL